MGIKFREEFCSQVYNREKRDILNCQNSLRVDRSKGQEERLFYALSTPTSKVKTNSFLDEDHGTS